jgi:hypothetical protein
MNPGDTMSPFASIVRAAVADPRFPTDTMRSPLTAMSA